MIIKTCVTENFASYSYLAFDFQNQGLTLIQGDTGSGKSTLCDIVPWVLYGKTAKRGSVDDVMAWPGDKTTKGTLVVDDITVTRIRSPRAKDNDLYYEKAGEIVRGKDILDTQKLLNSCLGINYETYLSGAYMHEFSDTAAFFVTAPKNRRSMCEQLIDLTLVKRLQTAIVDKKKKAKAALDASQSTIAKLDTTIEMLLGSQTRATKLLNTFDDDKAATINAALSRLAEYEKTREKDIAELKSKHLATKKELLSLPVVAPCPQCGVKKNDTTHALLTQRLKQIQVDLTKRSTIDNPHLVTVEREETRVNNYATELVLLEKELSLATERHAEALAKERVQKQDLGDITILEDALITLRGSTIINTIKSLEAVTNELLAKHFDAEIQVDFTVTEDIDVEIRKDNNTCAYGQLSKGQRQLLKLCFSVAIMRQVSNHTGVSLPQIFFDEALDGLSDIMKGKAYNLLQALETEYDSVFVVDHSAELKALFNNQYKVQLVNGESQIEKL